MVEAVEGARAALPLLAFAVVALWEKRDRERKLLTRDGLRGDRGRGGSPRPARRGHDGPDRRRAAGSSYARSSATSSPPRARGGRRAGGAAVGLPGARGAEDVLRELIDARLLTTYEVEGAEGEPSHHRVEVVHESLLKAWPRLVRWQAQDEEGALLRDQLKQAAHLWEEKGRTRGPAVDAGRPTGSSSCGGSATRARSPRSRRDFAQRDGGEGAAARSGLRPRSPWPRRSWRWRRCGRHRRLAPPGRAGAGSGAGRGPARRGQQAAGPGAERGSPRIRRRRSPTRRRACELADTRRGAGCSPCERSAEAPPALELDIGDRRRRSARVQPGWPARWPSPGIRRDVRVFSQDGRRADRRCPATSSARAARTSPRGPGRSFSQPGWAAEAVSPLACSSGPFRRATPADDRPGSAESLAGGAAGSCSPSP